MKTETQLAECHWLYFFAKYSKSTQVGLGGMAWIGTLFNVSIGIIGNSKLGIGLCVPNCSGVNLGGEH